MQKNRIAVLLDIATSSTFIDDAGLLRALIQCLSSDESVSLLLAEAGTASGIRDAVLRKVVRDAKKILLPAHHDLVDGLILNLLSGEPRARQGIGYCLSSLLPTLPPNTQVPVLATLIESRFLGIRRRGYKVLGRTEPAQIGLLLNAWQAFRDPECAWILVKQLPPLDLLSLKADLLTSLSEGWMISHMYLRIAEVNAHAVNELRRIDGISYSYVLAKLGRTLTVRQARALLKKYETDERFGLLVWSIGQMRLWDVLRWLSTQMPAFQERRGAAFRAAHGF